MKQGEPLLFHSHLSTLINCGLLDPRECCEKAEKAYRDGEAPLNAVEGSITVDLTDEELASRRAEWSGPRPTNYASGALWKYAQLVGPTYLGAVTHPGAAAETHDYMDL